MKKTASDAGLNTCNVPLMSALKHEYVESVLQKCRNVMSKMNKSTAVKRLFLSFLKQFQLEEITPSTECRTRWGSTYTMICDILTTLPAFEKVMEQCNTDVLDDNDVRGLKSLRTFLEPYYALTKMVCASNSTCSLILAGGKLLLARTEMTLSQSRSNMRKFGELLLAETTKHFAAWFASEIVRMSTLLDPRFAFLESVLAHDDWWKIAQKIVDRKHKLASFGN